MSRRIPHITSEAFTYDKDEKSFTGMMSTVQSGMQEDNRRISLFIKSQWTGKIKRFDLENIDKSNDVWIYHFLPATRELRQKGITVTVFND